MRSAEDLTTAATIRDAAVRLFARRGMDAVSVRDIAAEAGVSAALVMHHFGSKEGLRAAVDRHAIAWVERLLAEFAQHPETATDAAGLAALFAAEVDADADLVGYLRRILVDGGDAAETLFRALFGVTMTGLADMESAGVARPGADPQARAAFLLVNDLALMVLREQVYAVTGIDPFARDGMARWSATVLEIYTDGFLTPGKEQP